jgi:curli biogenesis system outer membrane secretion channel CsgG
MRNVARICVALALLLGMASPALAQAKVRVAIMDFSNNTGRSWWFDDRLGPAARNQIDSAFSENAALRDKFTVVEREALELVMKEQGLSTAGAVDPQTAARVGKLLGVKYIITGGFDKLSIESTRAGVGRLGVGGQVVKAEATLNLRFIDTTTAERVVSVSAEADMTRGGGSFRGNSLSRDNEWGLASELIERAAKDVVAKLVEPTMLARISPGTGAGSGLEGRIAKVDGNRAWLNIGSSAGVKVGDKFTLFSVGDAIVDPDTGMSLGADEKQTGAGAVTEVQERFAIITFTGAAKVKDTARKQ